MSFLAQHFSFDGRSCTDFNLMIYDFGTSNSQGQSVFASPATVIEDRINRRLEPLIYGVKQDGQTEISIVVGLDCESINSNQHLERYDLISIGNWLCTDGYRWLEIEQPDMSMIRYKCIVSEIKVIDIGWIPYGLSIKFLCSSSMAYTYPETYIYTTTTSQTISLYSKANNIGYYYPNFKITLPSGSNSISIKNITDNNREMKFINFTNTSDTIINIDNQNQIITENHGVNFYQYFNFNFFRLLHGDNSILISGNFILDIICEFPICIPG